MVNGDGLADFDGRGVANKKVVGVPSGVFNDHDRRSTRGDGSLIWELDSLGCFGVPDGSRG